MAGSRNPTVSGVSVPNSGGSTDYPSATWPTEADARIPLQGSLCRLDQHAGDQGLLRVAPRRSPRALARFRASQLAAIRPIATSCFSSCILASVPKKGMLAATQGGKVASLSYENRLGG